MITPGLVAANRRLFEKEMVVGSNQGLCDALSLMSQWSCCQLSSGQVARAEVVILLRRECYVSL